MLFRSGTGEFFLDGVATQVKMGDMIFAEANVLHGVRNTGDTRMTFYFIKMMEKHASWLSGGDPNFSFRLDLCTMKALEMMVLYGRAGGVRTLAWSKTFF